MKTIEMNQTTLLAIFAANLTDLTFLILLSISCIAWFIVMGFGHTIYPKLVQNHRKKKLSAHQFTSYLLSLFNAILISTASLLILYKFSNPEILENITESHPDFWCIQFFRYTSITGIAYFLIIIPYELFVMDQSMRDRLTMLIHHIIALLCQLASVSINPFCLYFTSCGGQVEFSTIFLNLRTIAMAGDNKSLYFISGVGIVIFYPLTRIIIMAYAGYKFWSYEDIVIIHGGVGAFVLGMIASIFIIIMSCGYFSVLLRSPKRLLFLKVPENIQKSIKTRKPGPKEA